jgi:hypothetical protein
LVGKLERNIEENDSLVCGVKSPRAAIERERKKKAVKREWPRTFLNLFGLLCVWLFRVSSVNKILFSFLCLALFSRGFNSSQEIA